MIETAATLVAVLIVSFALGAWLAERGIRRQEKLEFDKAREFYRRMQRARQKPILPLVPRYTPATEEQVDTNAE